MIYSNSKKIAIETHHQKHEMTLQSFKYPDYSYSCHQRSYFRQIDKERSINSLSLAWLSCKSWGIN